jgi:hypothetical protein
MSPRTGLDDMERRKILLVPELELRPLGRPARSQSLYRLSHRGFHVLGPTKLTMRWVPGPLSGGTKAAGA